MTYWAITGLGWGRADEAVEAVEVYLRIQKRNFPHLTDEDLAEAWGFVWRAPEGATGFFDDGSGMTWRIGEEDTQPFEQEQKVLNVGNVPQMLRL